MRLADGDICRLDIPDHFAGLGVHSDELAIQGAQDELAVTVRQSPVDQIAARDRPSRRVLLRPILPHDLFRMLQIDRVDVVRVCAMDIHDPVDDERTPLVAVEDAGGERPGRLQVFDVARIDLVQLTESLDGVVLRLHHPVAFILGKSDELFVGRGHGRCHS